MERWSTVNAEGVHLATLRIWSERDQSTGKQRMSLFLPPEHQGGSIEQYQLDMVQESVENQIVVAEMDKEPGNLASRASEQQCFPLSCLCPQDQSRNHGDVWEGKTRSERAPCLQRDV